MSSASKVGEIFTAAGQAFSKLGELTMQLHSASETSPASGKWSDVEVDMLHTSVTRFAEDVNKISDVMRNRTVTQMKTQLKRKAYTAAGLEVPVEEKVAKKTVAQKSVQQAATEAKKQLKSEVTLSALNAVSDADVDIEALGDQPSMKKLEFDSGWS